MYNSVTPKIYFLGVLENKIKKIYMHCLVHHESDPYNFEWDIMKKRNNKPSYLQVYSWITNKEAMISKNNISF